MPNPELGLAAFQASSECISLLVLIIRTAVKARRLQAECAEVERTARILKSVLDSNSNSIAFMDPEIVTKLSEVLREILEFVNVCQSSNLFDRLLEVSWKNRLPRLLKELMTWIAYFTMQTTVALYPFIAATKKANIILEYSSRGYTQAHKNSK